MQMNNQNFYTAVRWILILVIAAAALTWFNSCAKETDLIEPQEITQRGGDSVLMSPLRKPIDHDLVDSLQFTVNDTLPTDTAIIDTLPVVIDTPCLDPIEITDPAFVTLYIEFDVFDPFMIWQGAQVESNQLADVVQAVTSNPYTIYNLGKSWAVIIDNTNDNQSFYLKIFARSNGAKVYMGAIKQGFIFAGALTFDQFKEVAIKYPSVDRFNFRATQYDSLQYIELANIILGDCKAGRTWADFRFNPFEMDPAIITEYQTAGWETVLH